MLVTCRECNDRPAITFDARMTRARQQVGTLWLYRKAPRHVRNPLLRIPTGNARWQGRDTVNVCGQPSTPRPTKCVESLRGFSFPVLGNGRHGCAYCGRDDRFEGARNRRGRPAPEPRILLPSFLLECDLFLECADLANTPAGLPSWGPRFSALVHGGLTPLPRRMKEQATGQTTKARVSALQNHVAISWRQTCPVFSAVH